jgi:hypothetical protein
MMKTGSEGYKSINASRAAKKSKAAGRQKGLKKTKKS